MSTVLPQPGEKTVGDAPTCAHTETAAYDTSGGYPVRWCRTCGAFNDDDGWTAATAPALLRQAARPGGVGEWDHGPRGIEGATEPIRVRCRARCGVLLGTVDWCPDPCVRPIGHSGHAAGCRCATHEAAHLANLGPDAHVRDLERERDAAREEVRNLRLGRAELEGMIEAMRVELHRVRTDLREETHSRGVAGHRERWERFAAAGLNVAASTIAWKVGTGAPPSREYAGRAAELADALEDEYARRFMRPTEAHEGAIT